MLHISDLKAIFIRFYQPQQLRARQPSKLHGTQKKKETTFKRKPCDFLPMSFSTVGLMHCTPRVVVCPETESSETALRRDPDCIQNSSTSYSLTCGFPSLPAGSLQEGVKQQTVAQHTKLRAMCPRREHLCSATAQAKEPFFQLVHISQTQCSFLHSFETQTFFSLQTGISSQWLSFAPKSLGNFILQNTSSRMVTHLHNQLQDKKNKIQ